MGLFPGGPRRFSERCHQERAGDFVQALKVQARGQLEEAFVAGWALHLYTDKVVHPWIDEQVDALFAEGEGRIAGYPDLWHMRLEWGIDCRLLERDELRFLWEVVLHFPRRASGDRLLAAVGREFYGEDAHPALINRGEKSVGRWTKLLPRVLLHCGKIHANHRATLPLLPLLLDKLTEKVLGEWLEDVKKYKSQAALAKPWFPNPADLHRVTGMGQTALDAFDQGRAMGFTSLVDQDLENGSEDSRG